MQATGNNKSIQPYSLSIRFHADGFSFYVCNPQSGNDFTKTDYVVADPKETGNKLEQALLESPLIVGKKYSIISALFDTPTAHIPLEFFNKDERDALYEYSLGKKEDARIHYNVLSHLEAVELFAIPKDLEYLLLRHFPTIHFYAQNSMILERTPQFIHETDGSYLYCYCYRKKVFLYSYRNRKIAFANEFNINGEKDIVYYLLSTWKMLQMDALKDKCILIQHDTLHPQLTKTLQSYLRNVEEAQMENWFRKAPLSKITSMPFDILSLLLNGF